MKEETIAEIAAMAEAPGSEIMFDDVNGRTIINETMVPTGDVMTAAVEQHPELRALLSWASATQGSGRGGSLFERDRYVTPERIFDQFRTAKDASESDDVVSGVVESTEALAFSRITFSCIDEDEEDIWNQIAGKINLDEVMRKMWRETFICSQFYASVLWGRDSFKVRGKSDAGVKRKKPFEGLLVPQAVSILDPLKIVPVGNFMFGEERLAYIATRNEATSFDEVLAGKNSSDLVVRQLIEGRYEADREEKKFLAEITGVNVDNLFLMRPDRVFRHTATRPDYQRFAPVRMKSVFELLDLKHQLRQMDRAHLIGGTNFIILVKRGSEAQPAKPAEVAQMASQIRTAARVPVIVADHRVEIEIITPDMDVTLKPERYNSIDARITARLYQIFMTGNYSAGAAGDDSIKLIRVVSKGLESKRHMIKRSIEKYIIKPVLDRNDKLTEMPKLKFHPKRVALDFDNSIATYLQDLRDRGDISRETMLAEVDLDQQEEMKLREREAKSYDKVFKPVIVPFSSPQGAQGGGAAPAKKAPAKKPAAAPAGNTKGVGRRGGGNSNGGGANRQGNSGGNNKSS